jgi:Protein of unknown function (DUF4065)
LKKVVEALFKYDRESMLTAVLYILDKVGVADWHLVHKTFYIADKKSIAEYGKPISGNTYIRMNFGPVPSELDYLLEALRQHGAHTSYFGVPVTDLLRVEGKNQLQGLQAPNLKYLSRTDRDCLDHAIDICKGLDFNQRTLLTHDFAWHIAEKNGVAMRWEDIAIAGGGGVDSVLYLHDLSESQANLFPSA